jgi:hypothetical protein
MSELERTKKIIDLAKEKADVGQVYTCLSITKNQRKFGYKDVKNLKVNDLTLDEIELLLTPLINAKILERVMQLEKELEVVKKKIKAMTEVPLG